MELTRRRRKELNRLRHQAENLWDDQREVLEQASRVVRDASRTAARYARDDMPGRMKDAYEDRVRPAMRSSVASARSAAHNTRERVVDEVLPSVTSALGSALAALEIAKTQRVQGALKRVKKAGARADILESKKTGPGRYILAGVALVAVIGVAYAAWQTLREDDGAWIDDEASTGVDEDEL